VTAHALIRCVAFVLLLEPAGTGMAAPPNWSGEWPRTDFSKAAVPLDQITSGGPAKNGIPAIDNLDFVGVSANHGLSSREPVISVHIGDRRRDEVSLDEVERIVI
jgi:hypothetical protein